MHSSAPQDSSCQRDCTRGRDAGDGDYVRPQKSASTARRDLDSSQPPASHADALDLDLHVFEFGPVPICGQDREVETQR
jgi:hypothetical protein